VALHAAAQLRDVLRFGEIHFEQEPRPRAERQQVLRGPAPAAGPHGGERLAHGANRRFLRARFDHQRALS
jgi:hypothetical protein